MRKEEIVGRIITATMIVGGLNIAGDLIGTARADGPKPTPVPESSHPSGKDRDVEPGKSGDQGKSPSNPDGNGVDKPHPADGQPARSQGKGGWDMNNGCGNDTDFSDDNRGNCGGPEKPPRPTGTPSPTPTLVETRIPTPTATPRPSETTTPPPETSTPTPQITPEMIVTPTVSVFPKKLPKTGEPPIDPAELVGGGTLITAGLAMLWALRRKSRL
jgi:hypothetical protein